MSDCSALRSVFDGRRSRSLTVAYQHGHARTLGDLERRVHAWKAAFEAAPGSRYVVHFTDALEFAAALFGVWYAGKSALVPSDVQLASIAASGIVVDGYVGTDGDISPAQTDAVALPALNPETPSLEVFTSGTTGQPAAISKCLRQLDNEIAGLSATLDWGPLSRRVVGTVSHQHMYGMVFRVLLPLASGRPFEAFRLSHVQDLAAFDAPEGCNLVSSPAQLVRLPDRFSGRCRVASVLSAGGPLDDVGVYACHQSFGVTVTEIYGSSETGAVAWRRRAPGKPDSWKPLPGVEFRTDEGQLELRTLQLPTAHWYRTADRVAPSPDGFEITGRADRIVKLDEKRVSLDAVERVLMESGCLAKVRALVIDGRRRVLAVAAMPTDAGWELASEGKHRLVDRLQEHLRGSAMIEVLPRSWRFVDPWPVSPDGKTPEAMLRERFDRRNPEFRVLGRDAGSCEVRVWVSPTAPFFSGHFPGQPILPGVAQIDWLIWLCGGLFGNVRGFAGLEAVKFKRVITPGCILGVTLRNDVSGDRTAYEIRHDGQICASGRIRWRAES